MRDGGRVKVVKQRTDHDVRGRFARGHSFVESHRERAFVGVDVSVEDHTDVELHQQLLHGSTHGDRVELVLVRGIGVVPVVRDHRRIQVKIDSKPRQINAAAANGIQANAHCGPPTFVYHGNYNKQTRE